MSKELSDEWELEAKMTLEQAEDYFNG